MHPKTRANLQIWNRNNKIQSRDRPFFSLPVLPTDIPLLLPLPSGFTQHRYSSSKHALSFVRWFVSTFVTDSNLDSNSSYVAIMQANNFIDGACMHEHVIKAAFVNTFSYYRYLVVNCRSPGAGAMPPKFYSFTIGIRVLPWPPKLKCFPIRS